MADNAFDFKLWMKEQTGRYQLIQKDNTHFLLHMHKTEAEINFYDIGEGPYIVEFKIEQNGENKFYLHFQPVEEEHAENLFNELVHKLYALEDERHLKVLLCCSAGLTTTFFAQKLNQTASDLGQDIGFDAVDVNQVYAIGNQYDAVLVAPQVGYMTERLQKALPDIPVTTVNAQIFGSYDALGCIAMVMEKIKEAQKASQEKELEHLGTHIDRNHKILVIAGLPNASEAWVRYRIYDHGQISHDGQVIKETFDLHDLTDLIDTNLLVENEHPIEAIGIAVQGMIHHGQIELFDESSLAYLRNENKLLPIFNLGDHKNLNFNQQDYLRSRYHIPVYLHNNVNAAVTGWYVSQDKYTDIVFLSNAAGYMSGGMGIITNDHLITGAHDSAGEPRYLTSHIKELSGLSFPVKKPEDMVKVVSSEILTACAVLDPEVVCIRSPMTPDMNEIKQELEKSMPASHIPDLIYIPNMDEYVLSGEMVSVLLEMHHTL